MIRLLAHIALMYALATPALAVPADSLFRVGNELLVSGDARGALATFEAIEASGWTSVSLHLNASTAALRAGDTGTARLHAERARTLAPLDRDVSNHAEDVRRASADSPSSTAEAMLRAGWRLTNVLSPVLTLLALSLTMAFISGLWALHALSASAGSRTFLPAATASVMGTALLLFIGLVVFAQTHPPAVVAGDGVELREVPGQVGAPTQSLRGGSLLRVGSSRGEWRHVVTADGSRGWVEEASLSYVWE